MRGEVSGVAVAISDEYFYCFKNLASYFDDKIFIINLTRADSRIVNLNILLLCAGLINGEDPVWQILAGEGEQFFVILNIILVFK